MKAWSWGRIEAGGTHLLTFGGGSHGWRGAAQRLRREALASGWFTNVVVVEDRDLSMLDAAFFSDRVSQFCPPSTGYGYWSWKPFVLDKYLHLSELGAERVMFIDAGCHLNSTSTARTRFAEYERIADDDGALLFHMSDRPERDWTSEELMKRLGISQVHASSPQVLGGVLMLSNSPRARGLVRAWNDTCLADHGRLLIAPGEAFHRYDQSILSCLSKVQGFRSIPDETYFAPDWRRDGTDYPVWAVRNPTSVSFVGPVLWRKAVRAKDLLLAQMHVLMGPV